MPITPNNRTFNTIAEDGLEELAFIEIDYGVDVSAETGDVASSANASLGFVEQGLQQFVNILGKGPLTDSSTRQAFIVRADGCGRDVDTGNDALEYNTFEASVKTALVALDTAFGGLTPGIGVDLSGITVFVKALDLQTAAVDDSTAGN
jgi:hypothetical protein|tara:strand:+ start:2101 stop:2547 length:447 start_codon:yes stop_codon:yes gene_type:complete